MIEIDLNRVRADGQLIVRLRRFPFAPFPGCHVLMHEPEDGLIALPGVVTEVDERSAYVLPNWDHAKWTDED